MRPQLSASDSEKVWEHRFAELDRHLSRGKGALGNGENGVISISCTLNYLLSKSLNGRIAPAELLSLVRALPLPENSSDQRLCVVAKIVSFLDTIGYLPQALDFSYDFLPPKAPLTTLALANLARFQGELLRQMGRLSEAISLQQAAAAVFQAHNLELAYSHCLNNLGTIELARDSLADAQAYFETGLTLILERETPVLKGHFYNNLGIIETIRGHYDQAQSHLARALVHRQQGRDYLGHAETLYNQGQLFRKQGRTNDALGFIDHAIAVARAINQSTLLTHIQVLRAELYIDDDDPQPALALVESARLFYLEQHNLSGLAESLRIRGVIFTMTGRETEAQRDFDEALRISRQADSKLTQAQIYEALANLDELQGNRAAVCEWLNKATDLYRVVEAEAESTKVQARLKGLQVN